MKNPSKTLTQSSIILIISTAVVKLIGALFKIPLASEMFLGEIGFGYYSVAHDLYTPFYTLAISGLPVALSHIIAQKISKNKESDAYAAFLSCRRLFMIFGVIFSVVIALLSVPIVFISQSGIEASYSVFAVVPSVFLCFIISAYRGYFEGYSDMMPTAISKVIEALVKLILGLAFAYVVIKFTGNVAFSAAAAMLAITLGTAFSTVYLLFKHKKHNITDKINAKNLISYKRILKLAAPFVIASLTASFVAVLDIFVVKIPIDTANDDYIKFLCQQYNMLASDVSAYLYGVRSKAFTIYNLIPTFTTAIGVGALPIITGLWAGKDEKALNKNVNYMLKLVCFITLPAAVGMFVLSERIMSLLYFSANALDVNMLRLYACVGLFAGISIPITTILQAIGKQKMSIINILVGICLKIVVSLSCVFIPRVNIYAAPLGTLVCYLYIAVSVMWGIGRTVKNINYKNSVLKPLISAVFCGIAAFGMSLISKQKTVTLAAVCVGALVYVAFILITQTFSNAEMKELPLINKLFKSKK